MWVLAGLAVAIIFCEARAKHSQFALETAAGWQKYQGNPVLGGKLGTCFDVSVLKGRDQYRMWFSWRPKHAIGFVRSTDGIHWGTPAIALAPDSKSGWEDDVNRPVVIEHGGEYRMWYTGQWRTGTSTGHSSIGYAVSRDGLHWKRMSEAPVLSPDKPWEKVAVMCPDVLWDASARVYRMWYSGGEDYEPNAIGYATSIDGVHWTKWERNPVFRADPHHEWERQRVTACQVIHSGGWFYMFYIGFKDVDHAQIGLARSRNGIDGWERLPQNPIIRTGIDADEWDHDACYKPFAIWNAKQNRWLLWYNGRNGHFEQIGLALHPGRNFGFPADARR
jgi:beta-1,2-mannobiose phosphorylase / 1,2-beta-oligomannan phosphorylase